ncbi:MAG: hypothetical protein ACK5V3_10775 [Bdellovibrionales bacterium]
MKLDRIRTVRKALVLAALTVLIMAFQNCGQPGQLAPLPSDNGILGDPSQPSVVYKDYSKDLNVSALASKVDVLVVVDNSGSMEFEQKNMAMRFGTLLQQLNNLNWRVAVTTTDVNFEDPTALSSDREKIEGRHDGQILAMATNKFWVSSEDSFTMAQDLFSNTVQRSERGSGREQGIKATYRALERSFVASSANSQFFRSDAALSVVIVSDADETPHYNFITDRNQPDKLLDYVTARFPTKPFSAHSIIVKKDDKNCLDFPNSENEGYGLSYASLSGRTAGIIGSVCDSDYSSQLRLIGAASAQLVKNVSLDCSPVDSDRDGNLDIKISSVTAGVVIPSFVVSANQIQFSQDLPVGSYKIDYRCLAE